MVLRQPGVPVAAIAAVGAALPFPAIDHVEMQDRIGAQTARRHVAGKHTDLSPAGMRGAVQPLQDFRGALLGRGERDVAAMSRAAVCSSPVARDRDHAAIADEPAPDPETR
jgi:hypothetical protein